MGSRTAVPTSARKHALCIGINDYPGTQSDLKGCVNDAKDWAQALKERGFDVQQLLDEEATGESIRSSIRSVVGRAKEGDLIVITHSAHGSFVVDEDGDEDDGIDECWCPHDVVENGPIVDDELNQLFSARKDRVRLVVISDSCHSGTVSRFAPEEAEEEHATVRFLAPEVFVKDPGHRSHGGLADRRYVASPPGRNSALLLSGCQDAEYSYDAWFGGRPNGAFTHVALRELKALPRNATYEEWHRRIRLALPSRQFAQTPNIYGEKGMARWGVFLAEAEESGTGSAFLNPEDAGSRRSGSEAIEGGLEMAKGVLAHRQRRRALRGDEVSSPRGQRKVLIAEGDSWFDFPGTDVLDCLEDKFGYDVFSCANKGDSLEEMAYSDKQLDKLLRLIEKVGPEAGRDLRGILLSGGGNDIAGDEFAQLLEHALSPRPGLNESIVRGVIDERLRDAYIRMLSSVSEVCRQATQRTIPILIHGYDYAVPDGRGFLGGWWMLPGPWLKPGFIKKGYLELEKNKECVKSLIDRFNSMLSDVAALPDFQNVRYVNLRGRLPNGRDYKTWWSDELHPTAPGFEIVANEFHLKL